MNIYLTTYIQTFMCLLQSKKVLYLPINFQESYRFYELILLDNSCILIEPNLESNNIDSLMKQIQIIQSKKIHPVILYMRQISNYRIKVLVKDQISFINGQSILYICIQTQMQDDGIKRFAIHIRDFDKLNMDYQEDGFSLHMNKYHELELWSYEPSIHGNSIIDDFSLLCLFKEDKDIRIEIELDELARRHGWLMDSIDL